MRRAPKYDYVPCERCGAILRSGYTWHVLGCGNVCHDCAAFLFWVPGDGCARPADPLALRAALELEARAH